MSHIQRALRACADTAPTPMAPHWHDNACRLMRQAADAAELWADIRSTLAELAANPQPKGTTLTDEQADAIADAHRWDTREGRRAMLRAVQYPAPAQCTPALKRHALEAADRLAMYAAAPFFPDTEKRGVKRDTTAEWWDGLAELIEEAQPLIKRGLHECTAPLADLQSPAVGPDDARDAARYRFIRDADRSDEALDYGSLMELAMESMDAAIDEAMAREAASHPPVQGSGNG